MHIKKHIIRFAVMMLLASYSCRAVADTVALSDDPNFIQASLLIVSPGIEPQQSFGHAIIRMECQEHNINRAFSFEYNGEYTIAMYFKGAIGHVNEYPFDKYILQFKEEGREVKSFSLNLELNEKARLWEVLDSLKTLPDRPFDIVNSHCFSVITESLDIALRPSKINWDEPEFQHNSYGKASALITESHSPWNAWIIQLPIADMVDESGHGRWFVYPTFVYSIYKELQIVGPDGSRRPLIKGEPEILIQKTNLELDQPVRPTPTEAALLLLAVVLLVTAVQFTGRITIVGRILDTILWVIVTVGGLALAIVTYAPGHIGGNWNWMFVVFNPLAWMPLWLCRFFHGRRSPAKRGKAKKEKETDETRQYKLRRLIWLAYGIILVAYASCITLVAPSTIPAWRIVAVGLAVRCFFNARQRRGSR